MRSPDPWAPVMWTIAMLVIVSLILGVAAWLFFLWTVKSGQYEDVEGIKYRMLDDDEPTPRASEPTGPARDDAKP